MKSFSRYCILICFLLLVLACSCHRSNNSPVAILGAFADEIRMLEDSLENPRSIVRGGMLFTQGKLKGKDVVLAYTGIGKVNAAMTATLAIQNFNPSMVIFTGIAGGVNPELHPADIVIAERTVHHDLNFIYGDSLVSYVITNPVTGIQNPVYFQTDTILLSAIKRHLAGFQLQPYETTEHVYQPRIVYGTIATGDAFVASQAKKDELIRRFGADVVEMEGAAVAQISYQYGIPFIIVRSISDSADENARIDIEKFLQVAAGNANRVVIQIIKSF